MRFTVLFLALVLAFSGCMCCFGDDVELDLISGISGGADDIVECQRPYIRFGDGCCLDANNNGICDRDELPPDTTVTTATVMVSTTLAPSTTLRQTTTTLATTTTTSTLAGCVESMLLECPLNRDCGGVCAGYTVMKLGNRWQEFGDSGYFFRFDSRQGMGNAMRYFIKVRTPSPERLEEVMPLSTGESFLDHLRFKVINYGESEPRIYVRVNIEDLRAIPSHATLLTLGGQSCAQMDSAMCEREYAGYIIRMVNRVEGGARITVRQGNEVPMSLEVRDGRLAYAGDTPLVIGGFFDRGHIIQGGYSLLYMYLR
jgi:hypothetical protein